MLVNLKGIKKTSKFFEKLIFLTFSNEIANFTFFASGREFGLNYSISIILMPQDYPELLWNMSDQIFDRVWLLCESFFYIFPFTPLLLNKIFAIMKQTQVKHIYHLWLNHNRISYWINVPINLAMDCKGQKISLSREGGKSSLVAKKEQNWKSMLEAKITKISY